MIMVLGYIFAWIIVISLGYLIRTIFRNTDKNLLIPLVVSLGLGSVSILMMMLGFLHNFRLPSLVSSLIPIYAALIYYNRGRMFSGLEIPKMSHRAIAIIALFSISSLIHIFLFPDLYKDTALYSVWARIMYESKKIEFVEGGPTVGLGLATNYPSAYQVITTFFYLFTGESIFYSRITSLIIAIALSILVYEWTKEFFREKKYGIYALLIFFSTPSIIFFSRSSGHYMYLTFQFSIACFFLKRYTDHDDTLSLYMSSVLGGFAALTTYLGGVFAPIMGFFLLNRKFNPKTIISAVVLFSLVISPWYLRNLVVLGNPLWPLGGGKYIDPNIEYHAFSQLDEISKVSGFNYETIYDLKKSINRLLFSYIDYSDASIYHALNPFFVLLAAPSLLIWFKTREKRFDFFALWFIMILCFYMIIFNYWNRYLILLSLPTIFLSLGLIERIGNKRLGNLFYMILSIFLINSIYLSVFWDECPQEHSLDDIYNNIGNHDKILEICYGDDIKIIEWVNENLPEGSVVATTDYKLLYYEVPVIEINSWFLRDLHYSDSIEDSVEILKLQGVTHLVVTGDMENTYIYPEYFQLIKDIDGKVVYRII